MKTIITILILAFIIAGCATAEIGRPVNQTAAQQIEIGKTTKAEVLSLMGSPIKQRDFKDGTSELVYGHMVSKGMALPFYVKGTAEAEKIGIKFDKRGIVSAIERAEIKK